MSANTDRPAVDTNTKGPAKSVDGGARGGYQGKGGGRGRGGPRGGGFRGGRGRGGRGVGASTPKSALTDSDGLNVTSDSTANLAPTTQPFRRERGFRSGPNQPRVVGSKILLSNLPPQLLGEDCIEIFETIGPVVRAFIHYSKDRRSLGTGEVHFTNKDDAAKAVEEFHEADIDGRTLYVKIYTPRPHVPRSPTNQPQQSSRPQQSRSAPQTLQQQTEGQPSQTPTAEQGTVSQGGQGGGSRGGSTPRGGGRGAPRGARGREARGRGRGRGIPEEPAQK